MMAFKEILTFVKSASFGIKSYYKKNEASYDDQFECHAGAFVAGVALIGDVVKIAK